MIRVSNRRRVRRLGRQAMGAAKTRNVIAVVAIALTTVLFTSLFTIVLSINDGFQEANFRQAGGYAHGTFKSLTLDQVDALKEDPLVEDYGLRRVLGLPTQEPFQKTHVEVAYSDANNAQWTYATPTTGTLPQEGTDQAATDTRVLELLGVTPEVGARFTLTFDVDGQATTQTFTLSGWWEYDAATPASYVLVPNSRVEAVFQEVGFTPQGSNGTIGTWSMDVMLPNSLHIDGDMGEILSHCGFQSDDPSGANYVQYGVNWGYTGSQLTENMDPITVLLVVVVLVLILLTGYLIIYNVFQISVANDIRFYGLLKTIGTTGRQIKAMLRQLSVWRAVYPVQLSQCPHAPAAPHSDAPLPRHYHRAGGGQHPQKAGKPAPRQPRPFLLPRRALNQPEKNSPDQHPGEFPIQAISFSRGGKPERIHPSRFIRTQAIP